MQELGEFAGDKRLHKRDGFGTGQVLSERAGKPRLLQVDNDEGGEAVAVILAGQALTSKEPLGVCIPVEGACQTPSEALLMRTAVAGSRVVDEGQTGFID